MKKIIRITQNILIITVLAIILASISSCKKNSNNSGSIKIIDSNNQEIYFNEAPKRVVILESSFACIWKLSGGDYVGVPENYSTFDVNGVPLSLNQNQKTIGTTKNPNYEIIMSLRPDLIIYSGKSQIDAHNTLIKKIKDSGYKCNYYAVNIDSFEDYLYTLKQFTILLDREDLYITNGLDVKEQIQTVINKAKDKTGPKVLLMRNVSGQLKTVYKDHITLTMLNNINCETINVDANSDNLQILTEKLIEFNPSNLLFVQMGDSMNQSSFENFVNQKLLSTDLWNNWAKNKDIKIKYLEQNLYSHLPNNKWGEAYEKLYEYFYE